MDDVLDVVLHDNVMAVEIRLVTELMVVASMVPGHLDQDVIDDALGIEPEPRTFPTQRQHD